MSHNKPKEIIEFAVHQTWLRFDDSISAERMNAVFRRLFVCRCEFNWAYRRFEYTAIHLDGEDRAPGAQHRSVDVYVRLNPLLELEEVKICPPGADNDEQHSEGWRNLRHQF